MLAVWKLLMSRLVDWKIISNVLFSNWMNPTELVMASSTIVQANDYLVDSTYPQTPGLLNSKTSILFGDPRLNLLSLKLVIGMLLTGGSIVRTMF